MQVGHINSIQAHTRGHRHAPLYGPTYLRTRASIRFQFPEPHAGITVTLLLKLMTKDNGDRYTCAQSAGCARKEHHDKDLDQPRHCILIASFVFWKCLLLRKEILVVFDMQS